MKKIMFNDRYGLTQAVLEGRKTMTRRIIPPIEIDWNRRGMVTLPISGFRDGCLFMDTNCILKDLSEYVAPAKYQPKYRPGEVVAVAQNYEAAGYARDTIQRAKFRTDNYGGWQIGDFEICLLHGWKNKMFVRADLMPHRIRITNVLLERLQDVSDEDCYKEGIYKKTLCPPGDIDYFYHSAPTSKWEVYPSPRDAFAGLIDKVSGEGTWASNPFVFVYEFELVK